MSSIQLKDESSSLRRALATCAGILISSAICALALNDVVHALTINFVATLGLLAGVWLWWLRPAFSKIEHRLRDLHKTQEELEESRSSAVTLHLETLQQTTALEQNRLELEATLANLEVSQTRMERMNDVLSNALDGVAHFDVEGRFTYANNSYAQMLESETGALVGQDWDTTMAPQSIDAANTAYRKMLRNGRAQLDAIAIRNDGTTFFVELVLVADRDPSGAFLGHFCFMRDIDAKTRTAKELSERETLLRTMSENIPVGIFVIDLRGMLTHVNAAYVGITGLEKHAWEGQNWATSIHPDDRDYVYARWFESTQEGRSFNSEHRYLRPDGQVVWTRVSAVELEHNGRLVGHVGAIEDISTRREIENEIERQMMQVNEYAIQLEMQSGELAEANAKLARLAQTDGLTGLINHRTFKEELEEVIKTASKSTPVSVILFDVDHFKKFNDQFGHPEGDHVLREVARVLSERVREGDLPARYGGEEFAVILPSTGSAHAMAVAERIRTAIESQPWEMRQVTVSVGVATTLRKSTVDTIVKSADEALYASKHKGRNQSTHYGALTRAA